MKSSHILVIGAIMVLLSGCSTVLKENDQQAFESDLSEASCCLKTLRTLDSGDIAKTRQVAMVPVFVDLASLPEYAAKSHPTPEQRQQLVALAREALDYMLAHRREFNPLLLRNGVGGLQKILTQPEDVRRLKELSDYIADVGKKTSETSKP
ncbi:MAG: hypothetical protein ABSD57_06820 [Verrucomicrobiota bacterium]|jgi:hypothetical protein